MCSSASRVQPSRSAPGGLEAEQRASTAFVDVCSSQTSGAKTVKNSAHAARRRTSAVRLGVPERDALRHELAEHDVEEGQDEEGEDVTRARREPRVERSCESACSPRAPMPSERERDAELHRGDEPRRVARDPATARARRLPWWRARCIRVRARGDERVLGRDEERVRSRISDRDGDELESEVAHAPLSGALGTGRELVHQS